MHVHTSAGTKNVNVLHVHTSSGTKAASRASVRTSSGTKVFYNSASASASPASVQGYSASNGLVTIVTDPSSVTVSGSGTYTYSWTLVSSTGGTWGAVNPTNQATAFRCSSVAPGANYSAVFHCTVTGPGGAIVTNNVTAYVENFGGYGY